MDTDKHRFLYKKESSRIIGCAMEVLNNLGHGLLEKPYENALVVEFELQDIRCQQQTPYNISQPSHRDMLLIDKRTVTRHVLM